MGGHAIPELSELSYQSGRSPLVGFGFVAITAFFVADTIMKDLPGHTQDVVRYSPSGLIVPLRVTSHRSLVSLLEHGPLGLSGRFGRLAEDSSQEPVSLWGCVAAISLGRLVLSRADPNPGG